MSKFINALSKRYEADIETAKANIDVYIKHPAGIGEHPDLAAAVDSQVGVIANAEDKLEVLKKHYNNENPELLAEDAQMSLKL